MSTAAPALAGDAAPPAEREHAGAGRLGAFPWLALAAAAGLLFVAGADALSRTGETGASLLFWPGLALIVFPAALRLTGAEASSGERAATVVLVGLSLYGIKVLRDPFAFTFADELAHFHNLQQIEDTGRLFGSNSILPVTPWYPGLESVSAGLARTGGTSGFAAGLIIIGAARAVFMLAVYLAFERLSGSARLAGLGALLCTAAPTFLFFAGQFSYESLAVPLAAVALFALVRRQTSDDPAERRRWGVLIVVVALGVVPTHHITAYALVAFLLAVSITQSVIDRPRAAPWIVTAIVAALALAWLGLVASSTIEYLRPVLSDALDKVVDTLQRESETRTLFRSTGSAESTPVGERLVALAGVALVAAGVLAGLHARRRAWRRDPVLVVFGLAAVGYLATLPFRLVPAAWETASRAGSFLFVGVGITAAAGLLWWLDRNGPPGRGRRAAAAGAVLLVICGGVIAGWPASLRLAQPFRVEVDGRTLEPPQVAAARWSRRLGTERRFGAQDADARLLLVDGRQTAFQGVNPAIADLLDAEALEPWQRTLLRDNRIGLLMTDRRTLSADNIAGYFFDRGRPELAAAATAGKFDRPEVDRLYDDGAIVVYDVEGLW